MKKMRKTESGFLAICYKKLFLKEDFIVSITLKDCLSLPSLSFGKVVAGEAGLDKIVSSVSVLEFFDYASQDLDVFTPNELILSAFYTIRNNPEKQCEAIKDLVNTGSIALVLFYVGKVMPDIDEKLLQTADKLNFPLIVLENDSYRIKYSDIISDVMGAILQEQNLSDDFITTTEKRLEQIPTELRTMENLLRIMSAHYKCSLLLSGAQVYFRADYRPSFVLNDSDFFYNLFRDVPAGYGEKDVLRGETAFHIYKMDFSHGENARMTLYAACHNTRLNEQILSDMCTCTSFFSTVWGYSLNLQSPQTLLSLIFKTEDAAANKYLRSAGISFDRIANLIIISSGNSQLEPLRRRICQCFDEYHKFYLADQIDGRLVLLSAFSLSNSLDYSLFDDLWRLTESYDEKASFFMDSGEKDISALKRTYKDYHKSEPALQKIFVNRRNWDEHDIMLSQEVIVLSETENKRREYLFNIIDTLKQDKDDLLKTLAIYMIDCDSKLNAAAQMLYLHRNTVTYRLNKARQLTNTNFTLMPASYDFYTALALWRYLNVE